MTGGLGGSGRRCGRQGAGLQGGHGPVGPVQPEAGLGEAQAQRAAPRPTRSASGIAKAASSMPKSVHAEPGSHGPKVAQITRPPPYPEEGKSGA